MKVLSVRQPFADLIVTGYKDIENRSRPTTHRGPLLIHASLKVDQAALATLLETLRGDGDEDAADFFSAPATGAIVGQVNIIDCVTHSDSEWFDGPYGYVLSAPLLFESAIEVPGKLGIWVLPDSLIGAVNDEIALATRLAEEG
jgi:hypothetical protein